MTRKHIIAVLINLTGLGLSTGLAWSLFGLDGRINTKGQFSQQVAVLVATIFISLVCGLISGVLLRSRGTGLLELPHEIMKAAATKDRQSSQAAA